MTQATEADEDALLAGMARRRWAFRVASAAAVAAALGLGWYLFLRQPPPEAICTHLDSLLSQPGAGTLRMWLDMEGGSLHGQTAPRAANWHQHCVWYYSTRRDHESMWSYGARARCVAGISEPGQITRCGL